MSTPDFEDVQTGDEITVLVDAATVTGLADVNVSGDRIIVGRLLALIPFAGRWISRDSRNTAVLTAYKKRAPDWAADEVSLIKIERSPHGQDYFARRAPGGMWYALGNGLAARNNGEMLDSAEGLTVIILSRFA